ncbi:MAG: carboxypeptidase regulatory-like domain-containing protein [Chloroflexota bacterium]|nr:carboxypeptidase regulatory-like domain-containing protein [Chloroflexota bacterium]
MKRILARGIISIGFILLALILAACGQANSGNTTGAGVSSQAQPTSDPNTSVSAKTPQASQAEPAVTTPSGSIVQGRITDAMGNPIAGVLVMPVSTVNPPQAVPEIAVLTDAQGRYTWNLSPGAYTFTLTREGYALASQPIVVKPDQPVKLDVTLQKQ